MTKEQILQNVCEDYGIDIIDAEISDNHLYLELSYNEADFCVNTDYNSKTNDFQKLLIKKIYQTLDNEDYFDTTLSELGLSDEQLTLINQVQESTDDLHDLTEDLNNELHNVNYTSFEDTLTEVLRNRAQILINDGYKNLSLMKNYARDLNIIAQSEPLYNALEKRLDSKNANNNVFLYPNNFFNFVTMSKNQNLIFDFQKHPETTLNQIIEENHLTKKD